LLKTFLTSPEEGVVQEAKGRRILAVPGELVSIGRSVNINHFKLIMKNNA